MVYSRAYDTEALRDLRRSLEIKGGYYLHTARLSRPDDYPAFRAIRSSAERQRSLFLSLFLHRCSIENGVGLAVTRSRTGSVSRPVEREEGKTKRPVERPVPRGGRRGSKNKRDTRRTSVPERGPAGRGQGRVLVQAVVALVRVEPLVQNGNRSLPGRVAGTCLLERTGTRADPLGPAAVVRGRCESQSLPASIEQILARGDDHRR